jgi:hypothetical protein
MRRKSTLANQNAALVHLQAMPSLAKPRLHIKQGDMIRPANQIFVEVSAELE